MTILTEANLQWTGGFREQIVPFPPNAYRVTGLWLDAAHHTHSHTATLMALGADADEAALLAKGKAQVLAYANDPANADARDP